METIYIVLERDLFSYRIHHPAFYTEKKAIDHIKSQPISIRFLLSTYELSLDSDRPRPLNQRFAEHKERRIRELYARRRNHKLDAAQKKPSS